MYSDDSVSEHTAATIKKWRRNRQISQAALATELGVHQTTIAKIENNERRPDFVTVTRIAQALQIPWEDLFVEPESSAEHLRNTITQFVQELEAAQMTILNVVRANSSLKESGKKAAETLNKASQEDLRGLDTDLLLTTIDQILQKYDDAAITSEENKKLAYAISPLKSQMKEACEQLGQSDAGA